MSADHLFESLIRQVRQCDPLATEELVRRFRPALEKIVRQHLSGIRVPHRIETEDVCQQIFANFFLRAAGGQFLLTEATDLEKLLARMARNQVLDELRRATAARRPQRRTCSSGDGDDLLDHLPDRLVTPSRVVGGRELLDEVMRRLTPEERHLADLRLQGLDWSAIAQQQSSTPDAVRKKLGRAYERVLKQLHLEDTPVPH